MKRGSGELVNWSIGQLVNWSIGELGESPTREAVHKQGAMIAHNWVI